MGRLRTQPHLVSPTHEDQGRQKKRAQLALVTSKQRPSPPRAHQHPPARCPRDRGAEAAEPRLGLGESLFVLFPVHLGPHRAAGKPSFVTLW